MEQITYILNFILKSFIHVWPYLLVTIPLMAAVYGITTWKVFGLYVAFSLFGSLFFGMLYYFVA